MFDSNLSWEEVTPAQRVMTKAYIGGRLRVATRETRRGTGQPKTSIVMYDHAVTEALRNRAVRIMTAADGDKRFVAFEACDGAPYKFAVVGKSAHIKITFGLFAWMKSNDAEYTLSEYKWDGARLVVQIPAYAVVGGPDIASVSLEKLATNTHTPKPPSEIITEAAVENGRVVAVERVPVPLTIVDDPDNPHGLPIVITGGTVVQSTGGRKVKGTRTPARSVVDLSPTSEPVDTEALAEARERRREAANTVEVVRPKKVHKPYVPSRVAVRPVTPATALQAHCKFLQLDPEFVSDEEGRAVLKTTQGELRLATDQAKTLGLLIRNVEAGYGATGLSELHNARFRPGSDERALAKLSDTADWLITFANLLEKVGVAFRIEGNLFALDSVNNLKPQE